MLGYTKQSYYKRLLQIDKKAIEEEVIVDLVIKKRKIWKKGSSRNLFAALQEDFKAHSIKIGRDKFFDLLRKRGLLIRNKQRKANTTFSYHHFHKYLNIIRELTSIRSGELIVSDITYIWIREIDNFAYLFLITDAYSRKIIGYCVSDSLKAISAVKALRMAIKQIDKPEKCIHHSDRGIQYCCHKYTEILQNKKILISMTENGDPLENAIAERINRTL